MRVVVADAGPLHYLVLINEISLLPRLFGKVLAPERVCRELRHAKAPASVRAWIESAPPWLEIQARATDETGQETLFQSLDAGEREAIALASAIGADLLLMDDRAAVNVARRRGLAVTGTLGILNQAAGANLVDLAGALIRLRSTNFRYRKGLIEAILADFRDRQS